jgi:hypothetical protein|tara:strand:- start:92 stop:361 length:270 start_codon:yes stop_codon:yes gene_type:complete
MVARVNGAIAAGSFIGHDIQHWSATGTDLTVAANASAFFDIVEQKATIVQIGVLKNAAGATAFATESPSAWTAATLTAAGAPTVTAVTY